MDPLAIVVPITALVAVVVGFSLARWKARDDHRMEMERLNAARSAAVTNNADVRRTG